MLKINGEEDAMIKNSKLATITLGALFLTTAAFSNVNAGGSIFSGSQKTSSSNCVFSQTTTSGSNCVLNNNSGTPSCALNNNSGTPSCTLNNNNSNSSISNIFKTNGNISENNNSYTVTVPILNSITQAEKIEEAILNYAGRSRESLSAAERLSLFHLREKIIDENVPLQCTGGDAYASVTIDIARYGSYIKSAIMGGSTTPTPSNQTGSAEYIITVEIMSTQKNQLIESAILNYAGCSRDSFNANQRLALFRLREKIIDENIPLNCVGGDIHASVNINIANYSNDINALIAMAPQASTPSTPALPVKSEPQTPAIPSTPAVTPVPNTTALQTSGYRCKECGVDLRTGNHPAWCKNKAYIPGNAAAPSSTPAKPARITDVFTSEPAAPAKNTTQTSGYRCKECGVDLRTGNHPEWCKNKDYQLSK